MKYRADMGKVVYLPPFQKTKDLYIPYIFSDEELSNIFAIADAYPMTNKFSSIPHIHMERKSPPDTQADLQIWQ